MSNWDKERETQQALLTELAVIFNSLDKGETAFDNLAPSIGFNLSQFLGIDALWLMGPALALTLIYAPLHWWIERRYRDSWEAYLTRERDRIDRIGHILDLIKFNRLNLDPYTKDLLNRLKNLMDRYSNDTQDLCQRLVDEKYANILGINIKNKLAKDEEEKEEEVLLAQHLFLQRLEKEQYEKYVELTKDVLLVDRTISKPEETINPELTELEQKLNTLSIRTPRTQL